MAFSYQHIDYLKRTQLASITGKLPLKREHLQYPDAESVQLIRILGLSPRTAQDRGLATFRRSLVSLLTGVHGQRMPMISIMHGNTTGLRAYIGTCDFAKGFPTPLSGIPDALRGSLAGLLPELRLDGRAPTGLAQIQNHFAEMTQAAIVVGTPHTLGSGGSRLDAVIRGMQGVDWGFVVIAVPADDDDQERRLRAALEDQREVEDLILVSKTAKPTEKRYLACVRPLLAKLESGQRCGLWHAAAYFFTTDALSFAKCKALAGAAFGGTRSRPDRARVLSCQELVGDIKKLCMPTTVPWKAQGAFEYPYEYLSLVTSRELGELLQPPFEEWPEYHIGPPSTFDVAPHKDTFHAHPLPSEVVPWATGKSAPLTLGNVLDQGQTIGQPYEISPKSLTRHALLVGTTGSGKTTTMWYLLRQLHLRDERVPFLVLEPAKSEYRSLLRSDAFFSNLRVFTLGDEAIAPFRLNPFDVIPGVLVQTHIDHLKALLNSTFSMYGAMPYVLERAIHAIYLDKGWNLSSRGRRIHGPTPPTLRDLHDKIDEIVEAIGYQEATARDISAALKNRVNSLRIGGKGKMMDTAHSVDMGYLLSTPTILELEGIADDDEKAFVMGLILMRMYEYYTATGMQSAKTLRHIMVIEEAHRLLANVERRSTQDVADMRGQAVEMFRNVLAEMRAYGEGIFIIDQTPSRLSPDVVKNTNLKIMHRIVADDDRRTVGAAMNLAESQLAAIVALPPGDAAVFGDLDDRPMLVRVPWVEDGAECRFPACQERTSRSCEWTDLPRVIATNPCLQAVLTRHIVSTVVDRATYASGTTACRECLMRLLDDIDVDLVCAQFQAIRYCCQRMAAHYGWTSEVMSDIRNLWMKAATPAETATSAHGAQALAELAQHFRSAVTLKEYPAAFCTSVCENKVCMYGFSNSSVTKEARFEQEFAETFSCKEGAQVRASLAILGAGASTWCLSELAPKKERIRAAGCFLGTKLMSLFGGDARFVAQEVSLVMDLYRKRL